MPGSEDEGVELTVDIPADDRGDVRDAVGVVDPPEPGDAELLEPAEDVCGI